MSAASQVLRLAQNAVNEIASNARPSSGSALRKLAKAIQNSHQALAVPRIPRPANDEHGDDKHLEQLMHSIHVPLNRLSRKIQKQEDAAGEEELQARNQFKNSSNSTYGKVITGAQYYVSSPEACFIDSFGCALLYCTDLSQLVCLR